MTVSALHFIHKGGFSAHATAIARSGGLLKMNFTAARV